jgi:hypothetical protein
MGKRGPRPMSDFQRALKGYGPRLVVNRPHPPATEPVPDMAAWLASDDCPLNWLNKGKAAPKAPRAKRR